MKPLNLRRDQWLGINPEFRAIVDHTPHAFVYDEDAERLVLTPIAIGDQPTRSNDHSATLLPA
jgi:hypothetical protein